ncbi:hypothetical protein Y032_0039g61 [Ancylostoma ceylanicum]|uniref:Uncharacterized protein n=1 Tax=Ancylostoma ceylanicum TaxID=53326 RepID=A0A016UJ55_9BILA|nr:hypothetical protein Y032_0039g61 [Ancylostoma ceylanicum]
MVFRAESLEESTPLNRSVRLPETYLIFAVFKSATRVAIEWTLIVHSRSRSLLTGIWSTPGNGVLDRASSSLGGRISAGKRYRSRGRQKSNRAN